MARLDNLTLRERVHEHLRREIAANRYPPGTALLEVPLSRELGVSRGPIREALRSLEAEGLVEITTRRGAVVTLLTKRDFLEAYQVREALEALGVKIAVPLLTDRVLADLDEHIDQMAMFARAGDTVAFFEANTAFHEALVAASGNRKLVGMHRRLMAQMAPYHQPSASLRGNVEQSIAEHRAIVAAARERDLDRAVDVLRKHIEVPQRILETLSDEEIARSAGLGSGPPVPDGGAAP